MAYKTPNFVDEEILGDPGLVSPGATKNNRHEEVLFSCKLRSGVLFLRWSAKVYM